MLSLTISSDDFFKIQRFNDSCLAMLMKFPISMQIFESMLELPSNVYLFEWINDLDYDNTLRITLLEFALELKYEVI